MSQQQLTIYDQMSQEKIVTVWRGSTRWHGYVNGFLAFTVASDQGPTLVESYQERDWKVVYAD